MAYRKTDRIHSRAGSLSIFKRMCVYDLERRLKSFARGAAHIVARYFSAQEMWRDAQPLYFTYCNRKMVRAVARRRSSG
jgi:hypothetical protein